MTEPDAVVRERLSIRGDVKPDTFLPWIRRHAAKLGLAPAVMFADASRIDLDLVGAAALIDMLEVGCELGPITVWVEAIERVPLNAGPGV